MNESEIPPLPNMFANNPGLHQSFTCVPTLLHAIMDVFFWHWSCCRYVKCFIWSVVRLANQKNYHSRLDDLKQILSLPSTPHRTWASQGCFKWPSSPNNPQKTCSYFTAIYNLSMQKNAMINNDPKIRYNYTQNYYYYKCINSSRSWETWV